MKKIFYKIGLSLNFIYFTLIDFALADGVNDPFEKATEKTEEATALLTGQFAVAICTLVIVIAAIALMMNKLRMEWAMRIIAGALLVGSAAGIATWVMS